MYLHYIGHIFFGQVKVICDNAVMESFYKTLIRELVKGANYNSPEQAHMDIFKYIELYYNSQKIHSTLGYLSPIQFEMQSCKVTLT